MVQAPPREAVEALRNSTSIKDQIACLRQLKNEIVGHDQRKEILVRHGALPALVSILSHGNASRATPPGNVGAWNTEDNGQAQASLTGVLSGGNTSTQVFAGSARLSNLEDEAQLQATLVLSSIAAGGPAFAAPIRASGAVQQMSHALGPKASTRLNTASLQALRSYATHCTAFQPLSLDAVGIFGSGRTEQVLHTILHQPLDPKQITLVAELIALVCRNSEEHRNYLIGSELLDDFGSLLVAWSYEFFNFDTPLDWTCPPSAAVPRICEAISAMITASAYSAERFCLSEPLSTLLALANTRKTTFATRHGVFTGQDALLPKLYVPAYKSVSFNEGSQSFPVLGMLGQGNEFKAQSISNANAAYDANHATEVCSWLLYIVRAMHGSDRLTALRLLALVNNGFSGDLLSNGVQRSDTLQKTRERERQLALVAVPLAVKLVQLAAEGKAGENEADNRELRDIRENATEVLALLIQSSKELQTAAVEAGAIKYVCSIFKKTFDNVPLARPMWSAKANAAASEQAVEADDCKVGGPGLPPELVHAMRCRQGALEALASIAKKEDVHRKAIVESGVVGCVIDSLNPFADDTPAALPARRAHLNSKEGNTAEVILAACHAATSMSRSVSLLRTSLIDAGIAKPIFALLKHSRLDIQTAATDVCCNLLLEFSPMRDDLMKEGVVKILAEHARRSEMGLRLASLWALKHLVLGCERSIKIQTLEELSTGWLVQAIEGEHREHGGILGESIGNGHGGGVSIGGLSSSNAAGEQVDLLNPSSMEVDEPLADNGTTTMHDDDGEDDEDGEVMYDDSSNTHYQASQLRSTLQPHAGPRQTINSRTHFSSVRDMERNPSLRALRDDVAIQEQALDFVRNLVNGEDCLFMVDHLLESIGSSKVFDLLTEKLAPALKPQTGNNNTTTNKPNTITRPIYQPTELILSTIHILTHLANASPRHRQLLIAQKPLLTAWLPHFSHPDRRVRVMCVWAVNSLTWIESEEYRNEARRCVAELRSIGIEGVVRDMSRDSDLDVRERVKTAVRQFESV